MNDLSKEQPVPPAEMARAEASLTPEQRVMNRVRANILAPLGHVDLSDEQKQLIRDYSDKAGEVGRLEFERLKKESPVRRLLEVLTDELALAARDSRHQLLIENSIAVVKSQVREWADSVAETQGLAAIKGETKTVEELVVEQIKVAKQQEEHRVPRDERRGIRPYIGVLVTDELQAAADVKKRMATAQTAERLLKKLGFLPEEASLRSLFALPLSGKSYTDSELSQLRWSGKPTRLDQEKVTGLQSESTPGVAAQVEQFGGDRALVWFSFKPEAVARSVAKIPAVTAA